MYGITYIDKYVVTHYGFNLEEDFEVILSNFLTESIYLPRPQNKDEKSILSILEKKLSEYTTDIVLYDINTPLKLGKITMTPLLNTAYGEESSQNAFVLYSYGNSMLYMSSGVLERAEKERYYEYMACSDQIIFGEHGKKYKNKIYFTGSESSAKRMIFGSSNLFLTQSAMMQQTEKGCEILSHPEKVELLFSD